MIPSLLEIHPEIQQALAEHKPVVALESTIIAHGMPWPRNAETALLMEKIGYAKMAPCRLPSPAER